MADKGFIKLHRCIWENELVWDERANHFQAWVDLLMLANYKDKQVKSGKKTIVIKRGTFKTSFVKLGARWGWDRRTVKDYILALEDAGMVTVKATKQCTTINIVNYERYQGFLENDVQQNVQQNVHQTVQRDVQQNVQRNVHNIININKGEEYKESKEINITPSISPPTENPKEKKKRNTKKQSISPFEELEKTNLSESIKLCLREWFEYKKQKGDKVYPTEIGFKKFINEVTNSVSVHGEEKVKKQFDYAMSRNWSGPYLDKIPNEKKQDSFTVDDIMQIIGKEGE